MFDTPQRLLHKNHKKTFPTHMMYLDVETKPQILPREVRHTFKLGWTCYVRQRHDRAQNQEKWTEWKSGRQFNMYLDAMVRPKWTLYVLGHNIFFDLQSGGFFQYFTRAGWVLQFIYDEGLTYILVIKKGNRTIKVISTTNYFNASVKEIGALLGYEKAEVDFDTVDDETLSRYCRRDVEIIKLAMEKYMGMIEEHDLGRFAMTKSSQAFTAFRHRFMSSKLYLHRHPETIELERAAYMGGRTEAFFIGEVPRGPFVSLDINSMYPYVMTEHMVPVRLIDYRENEPWTTTEVFARKYLVTAEIEVQTDEPVYAIRMNGKVCFPIGRFRCFVCSHGMNYAIEHGHLRKVIRSAWYEGGYIFRDYVDFFYGLRQEYQRQDNKIFAVIVKYLLNSLYGKWGEKKPITEEIEEYNPDGYTRIESVHLESGRKLVEYVLFNKRVIEIGKAEGNRSFVSISAHITEAARFYLWSIIKRLGSDRVLYCDTDSIKIRATDAKGISDLIDPLELGKLKIEDTFDTLNIMGPKHYSTEKERKLKGVPKSATVVRPGVYRYDQFLRQKQHMRNGVISGFSVKSITKEIKPYYDKGVVTPSGLVLPFRLESSDPPLLPSR